MLKPKLKRIVSIERMELILSTLNKNLIKEIYVKYKDTENGYHNEYIIQIGSIEYYIDTSAVTPEKRQAKNEKSQKSSRIYQR